MEPDEDSVLKSLKNTNQIELAMTNAANMKKRKNMFSGSKKRFNVKHVIDVLAQSSQNLSKHQKNVSRLSALKKFTLYIRTTEFNPFETIVTNRNTSSSSY